MITLLSLTAYAMEPTMCDPKKNTASVSAQGFCLGAAEYAEFGAVLVENKALKAELEARDQEIAAFESWKNTRDAEFARTLSQVDKNAQACQQQIELAQRRTIMERYGFALGAAVSTAAVIGAFIAFN